MGWSSGEWSGPGSAAIDAPAIAAAAGYANSPSQSKTCPVTGIRSANAITGGAVWRILIRFIYAASTAFICNSTAHVQFVMIAH